MADTFNAEQFEADMSSHPSSNLAGSVIHQRLAALKSEHRALLLGYIRNPQVSAKRIARLGKRAGFQSSESSIEGFRENAEVLDIWDEEGNERSS